MSSKQSSFHMGDEFNGNGEVRYLKGTQPCIHSPVSQENVQLTPDFGNLLLKVLGSIPVVISPLNMNPALLVLLGSMASVTQVIITKDPVTGNYVFKFNIISPQDFTNGSYPYTFEIMGNQVPGAMGVEDGWVPDGEPLGAKWKYYKNGSIVTESWVKSKGRDYYVDSDGYMKLGWLKFEDDWYYLRSNIEEGIEKAGHMAIHWLEIDGKWYYFHSDGKMAKGEWQQDESKKHWYYLRSNGEMAVSQIRNGEGKNIGKIYFVKSDGAMAVNETITDPDSGYTYRANSNGELTKVSIVYANAGVDKNRLSNSEQQANAEYIYNYLHGDWSIEAIAALCGNIERESHFNPGVWQKKDNIKLGYGLVQFDGNRFFNKTNLNVNSANNLAINDPQTLMDMELEFLLWECEPKQSQWLQGSAVSKYGAPYKMTFEDFKESTKPVDELTLVFHGHYERSSDGQAQKNERITNAQKWYTYFSSL